MATDAARYFEAEYRLYVSGLLIGKANVRLAISPDNYLLSAIFARPVSGALPDKAMSFLHARTSLMELTPQRLDLSWTSEDTIKSSYLDYGLTVRRINCPATPNPKNFVLKPDCH